MLDYLDFQTEEQGLQDISIYISELKHNDSNISGVITDGSTLSQLQESIGKLKEGDFAYTNQGLLVYVAGGGGSDNVYALRNENDSNREDHGNTKNDTIVISGIGPNYSFGTPFLTDNTGNIIEVQTYFSNLPIGSYEEETFTLNQDLINVVDGIQKLDKSQIPNASYSLAIPVSNTSNENTRNLLLGIGHKGLMGVPTMTRNNDNRINLGTFEFCSGNGTYSTNTKSCR